MEKQVLSLIKFGKPVRFLVAGILSNATNYSFYFIMVAMGMAIFAAAITGYLMGLVVSYLVNRFWVFRIVKGKEYTRSAPSQVVFFFLMHAFSALFMGILIIVFEGYYGLGVSISWVLAVIPIAVFNFMVLNVFVFETSEKQSNTDVSTL